MSNSRRGQRLIFDCGIPRSGTTLVQNTLDSHREIFGGPEFDQLPNIIDLRHRMLDSLARGRIDVFCAKEDIDEKTADFIEGLMLPAADRAGCKYLSDKHPDTVMMISSIIDLFPGAHILYLVRDPRAVISSLLQVGRKAANLGLQLGGWYTDLNAAINNVLKCAENGFAAASKAPPGRVYTVQYEQLIANPKKETKAWCRFLKMEWDHHMLTPGEIKHAGDKVIASDIRNTAWYDMESYYRNPEPAMNEKWKTYLSPDEQVRINQAFQNHSGYAALGYEFNS